MNLKPLYDRVVVLPQKVEELASSGIILPSVSEDKSCVGIVVCLGDGQTFDGAKVDMQVRQGQKILFSKFAGTTVKIEDKNYVIIRQADVLAIMED